MPLLYNAEITLIIAQKKLCTIPYLALRKTLIARYPIFPNLSMVHPWYLALKKKIPKVQNNGRNYEQNIFALDCLKSNSDISGFEQVGTVTS